MSEQADAQRTVKLKAAMQMAQQLSALLKIGGGGNSVDDPPPGSELAALLMTLSMVLPAHRLRPPCRN